MGDNLSSKINEVEEEYHLQRERFGSVEGEQPPDVSILHADIHNLRSTAPKLPLAELRTKVNALQESQKANVDALVALKEKAAEASKPFCCIEKPMGCTQERRPRSTQEQWIPSWFLRSPMISEERKLHRWNSSPPCVMISSFLRRCEVFSWHIKSILLSNNLFAT